MSDIERITASWESKRLLAEETFWWYRARRDILTRLVASENRRQRILEIGCSGGFLMQSLHRRGFVNVVGIDINASAVARCHERGLKQTEVMDGARLRFPDHAFDFVIASDVLEHIEDDHGALKEWHRVLAPGGTLVIFVPAFQWLWRTWDDLNHHHRRYSRTHLVRRLQAHRFTVVRSSYWNATVFLPALLARLGEQLLRRPPDYATAVRAVPPWANELLSRVLAWEHVWLMRGWDLPFGVSAFAIAKKS